MNLKSSIYFFWILHYPYLMKFIILFLVNLLFVNYLIDFLFERNTVIAYEGLSSIRNDFQSIGFAIEFEINSLFISLIVSSILSILIYFFVVKKFVDYDILKIAEIAFIRIPLIYLGTFTFSLYLLKVFNLSRGIILISVFIYTLTIFLVVYITSEKVFPKFVSPTYYKFYLLISIVLILTFILFNLNSQENGELISLGNSEDLANIPELFEGQELLNFGNCLPWSGSNNYKDCIEGTSLTVIAKFPIRLTNVVVFESEIYALQNDGVVYKVKEENEIYLDIRDKVGAFEEFFESGLFSLAFHPFDNYFIVSYSDKENNLIFEKYNIQQNMNVDYGSSEILLAVPNSQCCHYSGNVIWSDFFQDFIVSVGDMETNGYSEKINVPLLNSEPFDTTSPRGKILLLNNKISKPSLLSVSNLYSPREDIIGYGLRNPWKTYEYNNLLIIPDIGFSTQEELNIVDLNEIIKTKQPYLFGWPHYEGFKDNEVIFSEIFYFENGQPLNVKNFIDKNTIFPKVYYEHNAPANFRAALIGGGVISDQTSSYFEYYFFADYISKELFSYDLNSELVSIIPLPPVDGYITSLDVNPQEQNSLLLTTGSGYLFKITLP